MITKEGAVLGLVGDLALERSRTVTGPAVRQERCSQDPYENIKIYEKRAVSDTGPVSVMSIEENRMMHEWSRFYLPNTYVCWI